MPVAEYGFVSELVNPISQSASSSTSSRSQSACNADFSKCLPSVIPKLCVSSESSGRVISRSFSLA